LFAPSEARPVWLVHAVIGKEIGTCMSIKERRIEYVRRVR
jgi:hypothetical protein